MFSAPSPAWLTPASASTSTRQPDVIPMDVDAARKRLPMRCFNCGKIGHLAAQCTGPRIRLTDISLEELTEILGLTHDNPELAAEKVAAAHTRYSAQADHTTSDPTPAPAPATAPLTEVDAWYEQRLAELRQQLDELVAERARTIAPAQPAEDTQQGFRDGL